ncbi:MAG: FKBP-type peptidyl-prolyl cis-trans isomerase [Chitinophagaceae bacterium]
MMKFSWCFLVLGVLFTGCLKTDKGCPFKESSAVAPLTEQQQIEVFLSNNGLSATKHPSGMYYQVLSPGSGANPNLCSVVSVGYIGKLMNGNIFDSKNIIAFDLGRLVEGWKKGVPLIQKGGKIKLYIPPSLGYGSSDIKDSGGNVIIPANSILIFDVELFDVN